MMKDNISKRELHFEKEDAYKSLELVNAWINNLDTKASFLLAYLAVVLGFVVSNGRPNLFAVSCSVDNSRNLKWFRQSCITSVK